MPQINHLDWDLLRVFLAVMRAKSLRQAAQSLNASHPTVRRHLQSLEQQLGVRLFERRNDALQPTTEALALLEKVEHVESAIHAFQRSAENANPHLEGPIRISAPDVLMSELLAPDLADFCATWPQIDLHIEITDELADLSSREADIAFRIVPYDSMPHKELTGRRAATIMAAVYGTGHEWLGWGDVEAEKKWFQKTEFADYPIRKTIGNVYLQRALCLQGLGIVLLPCFMAPPELKRRSQPFKAAELWVLVHPDMQQNPRLRLFRDAMVASIQRHHRRIEGLDSADPEA